MHARMHARMHAHAESQASRAAHELELASSRLTQVKGTCRNWCKRIENEFLRWQLWQSRTDVDGLRSDVAAAKDESRRAQLQLQELQQKHEATKEKYRNIL